MIIDSSLQTFALEELKTLARIPSVSFPGFDLSQVQRSAEATAKLLKTSGFQNIEIMSSENSLPYVLGDFIVDPKLPTALLYAHHDVQPEGNRKLWKSDPFEPTLRDGRLYGRGTADDKAGVLVHATALKYFIDTAGRPPLNLKVVIEGEEEIGSNTLLPFLKSQFDRLKSDVIIVTDTANIQSGVPSLTVSLRGIVVLDVRVRSLRASLHSGMWGGGVEDPTNVLVKLLSRITNDDDEVMLDSVSKHSQPDKQKIPLSKEEFAKQAGVVKIEAIKPNFFHRIWHEPSFSINAIQASSEQLANNVICGQAFARIGIRTSEKEDAEKVLKELMEKLRTWAPASVELELKSHGAVNAWSTDPTSPKNRFAFAAGEKALKKAFGQDPVYIGCGGSIPFIAPFEEAMKAPVLSLGVEDPYTLAHSENESLLVSDFYKAIDGEIELFKELANSKA